MPNVDINGTVVEFPDDLVGNDLNQAVSKAASQMGNVSQGSSQDYWKGSTGLGEQSSPQTFPQKMDYAARKGAKIGMGLLNAPFEATGEAIRTAGGGLPFRLPQVVGDLGIRANNQYVTTQQPPMNLFSTPRKTIQGGLVGATQGPQAGVKEFNRTTQTPIESLTDLGTALGTGAVAPEIANAPYNAAQKMAQPLLRGAASGAKKLLGATLGPSEAEQNAFLANPQAIKSAQPYSELADKAPGLVNKLSDKIGELEGQAYNSLGATPEAGGIPKTNIQSIIQKIQSDKGLPITDADTKALSTLTNLSKRIDANPSDVISEVEVKDLLKRLNQSIDFNDPTAGTSNAVLKSFKGQLNQLLKTQNPAYSKSMKPIEDLMGLHENAIDQLKLQYQPGRGYTATPQTERAIATINGPYKTMLQDTLKRLGDMTGEDLLGATRATKTAQAFQPKSVLGTGGSRRTMAGAAIGGAVGHLTGSTTLGTGVGAGVGLLADTQGGPMAAKILETISNLPGINPQTLESIKQALPGILTSGSTQSPILGNRNLDEKTALQYLDKAGGDKNKALQMLQSDGY